MSHDVGAGDVERKISEYLSLALAGGEDLNIDLARSCYFRAIDELGLNRRPSDDLRIQDMFEELQMSKGNLKGGSDVIRRRIFEVIFSK